MATPMARAFFREVQRNAKRSDFLIRQVASQHRKFHVSRCEKYQIYSAVCVERYPVLTQPLKFGVQKRYTELIKKMEYERSVLSDHELRHLKDLHIAEARKEEDFKESDLTIGQTAIEFEDANEAELKTFVPAPRITEADKQNDLKSVERKLHRKLVLLVKQKLGDKDYWCLPQMRWSEGQSMRESAEAALSELCGEIDAKFIGNAPCAFFKYKYPAVSQEKEQCDGAKVFFYKAQFKGGTVSPKNPGVTDHMWLTLDELPEYVLNSRYRHIMQDFILEL